MKRMRAVLLIVVGLSAVGFGSRAIYKQVRWKRFAIVEPGKIYRSGQLDERRLENAIQQLKLRTVICLNMDSADWERQLCQEHGVKFYCYEMHSNGVGKPEYYREIVQTLADPAQQPVLVHCRAGVARTGASVALYRMIHQGWTYERALEELKSFERKGRCEPELQNHIAQLYEAHLRTGNMAQAQQTVIK